MKTFLNEVSWSGNCQSPAPCIFIIRYVLPVGRQDAFYWDEVLAETKALSPTLAMSFENHYLFWLRKHLSTQDDHTVPNLSHADYIEIDGIL